jgi:DNA-binding transcriptional MocR family regulator
MLDCMEASDIPWTPRLDPAARPIYAAIADAIGEDLRQGRLKPGQRLPPQRQLASNLGIDFTTVTRAYSEARLRGLVEARVGQGTFVRAQASAAADRRAPVRRNADMTMNLPPRFDDPALTARMWGAVTSLGQETGQALLLSYHDPVGALADRQAGVQWLRPFVPQAAAEQLLVVAGAQAALLAILGTLARPGDTICAEALTYPGLRSLAAHLGLQVQGLAMDADGLLPGAFEAACREGPPKALYCMPNLHNPTTAVLTLERRRTVVEIAASYGVPIVEDDIYGPLLTAGPPSLAALAPDLVYYVGGLSKVMSPALRIAYVAAPSPRAAARIGAAVRATTGMASPLTAAIATRWIETGLGVAALEAIRRETAARYALAETFLPPGSFIGRPEAFHLWLPLPPAWQGSAFPARLAAAGIAVAAGDAFATLPGQAEAVRIGLGAPESRQDCADALARIGDLLVNDPAWGLTVV